MTLFFTLPQAGWANASVEHSGQKLEIRFSYLIDSPAQMLDAAIGLMDGAHEVRFGFIEEPGAYLFLVSRIDSDHVRIQTVWHKDWATSDNDPGKGVFECECTVLQLSENIFCACKRLLYEHGEEAYKEGWHFEFPTEKFEYLSRQLYPPRRTK